VILTSRTHGRAGLVIAAIATLLFVAAMTGAAGAGAATLVDDSFASDHVDGAYTVGGFTGFAGSGSPYGPCLTASADLDLEPIPGCRLGQAALHEGPDPDGEGTLRLTDDQRDRASFVLSQDDLPLNAGLDIRFQLFAYDGAFPDIRGADGISFFLQDAARPLTRAGAFGGSLGYAQKVKGSEVNVKEDVPGVEGGYLGIGFDEFGNFANDNEGRGHGCGTPPGPDVHGLFPDHVSLRGPGEGIDGYCLLERTSVAGYGGIADTHAQTRDAGSVRRDVHIVIDPLNRPDARIRVMMGFPGEGEHQVLDEPLPAGRPPRVRFGFAASTGTLTDVHEIRRLRIDSVDPLPRLRLTKTNDGPFVAGGTGSFSLRVSVHGEAGATLHEPVTVVDHLPAGTLAGEAGGPGWSCGGGGSAPGTEVLCRFTPDSPLPIGSTLPPITVPVRFPEDESCTLENAASVASDDNSATPEESTGTSRYSVRPAGVPDAAGYVPGNPVEIPLLANDLGRLDPVTVRVTGAQHGTAVWEPRGTGGVLIYTPDPGWAAAERLTYTAADGCGQEVPPTPVTIDPEGPQSGGSADLRVTKNVNHPKVRVGDVLTYRISVANRGPSTATDVVYTDAPDARVHLLGLDSSKGKCEAALPIVCRLGSLATGEQVTITVRMRAGEASELRNTGAATASTFDPNPGGARDSAEARVTAPAELTLRKRASRTEVRPGDAVDFVVTVGAKPGSDADDVRVCDRLPGGLEVVSAPGATRNGRRLRWAIALLPAGTRRHFQILVRVRQTSAAGLTNVATAAAANAAPRRARAEIVIRPASPPATTG
jgi:uncharacterized repeat protein (TIGR01451 family)